MIVYRLIQREDLNDILRLCEAEGWHSYTDDPDATWRALTAPGSTTMVAVEDRKVVGFAQMQSDGLIQAHLSIIAVDRSRRGSGIGRRLTEEAFVRCGGKRVDLLSTEGADDFYRSFPHKEHSGFRIYLSQGKHLGGEDHEE
jgi:ribosomal protein S18 acetylase RimI-like enzyme